MTAIPNQHWGGENRTSVSRFVMSIVGIYLSGFVKTWLKKFQVDFNYLTSKWNRKQFKVTS